MKSIFSRAAALALLLSALNPTLAATKDEWRSRSIYRLLTDRFAPATDNAPCDVRAGQYCGGSFRTIMSKLDYIQKDLGFDAIWISPISLNLEGQTAYGQAYHGFWPTDLFSINPHFGTSDDLKALSAELHARGMYLMVDTVLNHLASTHANLDPAALQIDANLMFRDPNEYHSYCPINYSDRNSQLNCWMGDSRVALMDLNTENPTVVSTLTDGVKRMVEEYGIDGMRLDAIKHIPVQMAVDICKNAGDTYCIGEVYTSSPGEQANFPVPVENYALFYGFQNSFAKQQGMSNILNLAKAIASNSDDVGIMGTFIENQDQVRFAQLTQDKALTYNALAFQFLSDGIPIHYYGMEQDMPGGNDPENRAALWTRGYSMDATPTTKRLAAINKIHGAFAASDVAFDGKTFIDSRINVVGYTDTDGAIRKGPLLTVVTNRGSGGAGTWKVANSGWVAGTSVVDLLTCTADTVGADKSINVKITNGEPVVYATVADAEKAGLCGGSTPTPSQGASAISSSTALTSSTSTVPSGVVGGVASTALVSSAGSAPSSGASSSSSCKRKRRRMNKE